MNIEYINSYDINTSEELIEVFNEGKGIIINGRIYTSIDSILEVDYLNHRYQYLCELVSKADDINEDDFDNEVKTLEFERIGTLAYNIRFSDKKVMIENDIFKRIMEP